MKITFSDFLSLVLKSNHFNFSTIKSSYKIIYFKSGSGQIMIASSVFRFTPGMYAIIPPNEMYQDIVTSDTEEMICEFKLEDDVNKLFSGVFYDSDNIIIKQFEKLRREYWSQDSYRDIFLDLYSTELYYQILRDSKGSNKNTDSIEEIIDYIDEYFYEDIKIENLAKKAGYTCRHFRNLFVEKTGLPPSEYIQKKRVESSMELLLNSSQNIVEISFLCGFSSASQFSMLFKRYNRVTPSEYRLCNNKVKANNCSLVKNKIIPR